jgi:hypothetical protein
MEEETEEERLQLLDIRIWNMFISSIYQSNKDLAYKLNGGNYDLSNEDILFLQSTFHRQGLYKKILDLFILS